MQAANLVLRFLLELAALVALGAWGIHTGATPAARVLLGAGAPVLAAAVWGAFVAPRAPLRATGLVRVGIELAVFGAATAALVAVGRPKLAAAFALAVALNAALLRPRAVR